MLASILAVGFLLPSALAIRVANGSPCMIKCGNVADATSPDDIVCNEQSSSTFQNCLKCEVSSSYKNDKETDQQWMLYNFRYSISYCLFDFPDNNVAGSNPCITSTACGALHNAILFNDLAANVSSYDYCALWRPEQVQKCLNCLRPLGHHHLSNFFSVLDAGCQQQPVPGKLVATKGEIFSHEIVTASDPNPIPTLPPDYFKTNGLSLGAKVGIAFGGLAFVLSLAGCCIIWNGKRRRRAFLKRLDKAHGHKGWAGQVNNDNIHETPVSQRPLRGWDDSPLSAVTEKSFPRYFSPYSSQYNSPVSAVEGPSMQWPEKAQTHEIGLALGGDESSGHFDPPLPAKGKDRDEAYEMRDVDSSHSGSGSARISEPDPPVLHHPGYGRQSTSPPRRYVLTEEDARRGAAV